MGKPPGPLRLKYPSTPEKELLVSLTQVLIPKGSFRQDWSNTGGGLLQCLREGHSCGEHFLWRFNCLWWGNVISNLVLDQNSFHFKFFRIWEVSKNDLAGLHFKSGRYLWTLPWRQLHIGHRASLLVHAQALLEGFGKIRLILNVCKATLKWLHLWLVSSDGIVILSLHSCTKSFSNYTKNLHLLLDSREL